MIMSYCPRPIGTEVLVWWHMQEVEERLKQQVQPLSADLSLPAGLEKRMKTGQKGGGYGGSKEAAGYTKVRSDLAQLANHFCRHRHPSD